MFEMKITNLSIDMHLGITESERNKTQPVYFSFELLIDDEAFIKTHDIKDTVDYQTLASLIQNKVTEKSYVLMETLLNELGQLCLTLPNVVKVKVGIDKPKALAPAMASVFKEFNNTRL